MYIEVDPTARTASLREAEVFTAFHVSAPSRSDTDAILGALGELGRSCEVEDHVWVSVSGVRALAEGDVGPDWGPGFAAMVDYARTKGWTDDTGEWLQAHIERT